MFALGLQSSHNIDLKSFKIIPGKGHLSYRLISGVQKKKAFNCYTGCLGNQLSPNEVKTEGNVPPQTTVKVSLDGCEKHTLL